MNRRSFFGMFGALSAVTAAGILLPEPVKSYCFLESTKGFVVRGIRIYDPILQKWLNRVDIARSGSSFILELPPHMGDYGLRLESKIFSQREIVGEFARMSKLPRHCEPAFEMLRTQHIDFEQIRSVSWTE